MVCSNDDISIVGAIDTFVKISEDVPDKLEMNHISNPLDSLIPRSLQLFSHQNEDILTRSIKFLTQFTYSLPFIFEENLEMFFEQIPRLGSSDSVKVRREIGKCVSMLVSCQPETVASLIPQLCGFMLELSGDEDETVRLNSGDFWLFLCDLDEDTGGLEWAEDVEIVQKIVQKLIENLHYSEEKLLTDRSDAEIEMVGELSDSISRTIYGRGEDGASNSDWSLRKCCVLTLEAFSEFIDTELLLSTFKQCLEVLFEQAGEMGDGEDSELVQECGVLSLGSVSGCFVGDGEYFEIFGEVFDKFVSMFQDNSIGVELRCTLCFTLSLFSVQMSYESLELFLDHLLNLVSENASSKGTGKEFTIPYDVRVESALISAIGTIAANGLYFLLFYFKDFFLFF